jgi:hypothetical protein
VCRAFYRDRRTSERAQVFVHVGSVAVVRRAEALGVPSHRWCASTAHARRGVRTGSFGARHIRMIEMPLFARPDPFATECDGTVTAWHPPAGPDQRIGCRVPSRVRWIARNAPVASVTVIAAAMHWDAILGEVSH